MGRDALIVVGINHRTAPVAVRERLGYRLDELGPALTRLTGAAGVREAVIVSTCNRVEVIASVDEAAGAPAETIANVLADDRSVAAADLAPHVFAYTGRDALRHLFRVTSSLDSMIVGEPQILGQVKEHYEEATQAGTSGAVLHKMFHRAFAVAKRVRTETGIAGKAVSVASAAVDLARTIFENFDDKTAMLIGAGDMSELAARRLRTQGISGIIVTTRTFEHAVEVAREFGGMPVPFERLAEYLRLADVVIGSVSVTEYVITPALVHDALRARRQRPMFFIDMGVPRNFDPAINELANVYLYDIDDLGVAVAGNVDERERESVRAQAIVEEEVERTWRWFDSLEVVPTIVAIREKVEAIRQRELEKALLSLKDQAPRHRALLDALTSSIVNKILHAPISSLKSPDAESRDLLASARLLFDLEPPDDDEKEPS
ncbi:MAG TPA: glutamyl-tRNA reductase [Candidatus Binatia bacterium]|jgi:glutamyl-tRNA reductase